MKLQSESTLNVVSFYGRSRVLDKTDELILDLLQGNARMSFEELGRAIGMSRVAAKKRVAKLESAGIIASKSAGVKGTYIRILNPDIFEELETE